VVITGVNGGAPVTIGSSFYIDFTVKDSAGKPVAKSDLNRVRTNVAGPTNNYQRLISSSTITTAVVQNADGSYRYTFPSLPATTLAPIGGSATSATINNATYTAELEVRRTFTVDGVAISKNGDATKDFQVGSGAIAHREVVTQTACNDCHVGLALHGGGRTLVTGCVLCHTPNAIAGTESIRFADMIHKLHRGAELRSVAATKNGASPYKYMIGSSDFSDIEFPFMPGGTGFDLQTRNCNTCHGGAAQGASYHADASITQDNCTACHDDLNFTSGTILDPNNATVIAGTLTAAQLTDPAFRISPLGATPHNFSDGSCFICHGDGRVDAIVDLHVPPLSNAANINGIQITDIAVSGDTGRGYFLPGDFPIVTFNIKDANNALIDMGNVNSLNLVLSGPVENYQKILPTDPTKSTMAIKSTATSGAVTMTGGVPATGTGPFTYTSPTAIPATYPAPANDSTAFTFADGDGELSGLPLASGSYTVMVYVYRTFTIGTTTYREVSAPGLKPIRIGSTGTAAAYPGYVTDAKCNSCHGDLRLHGNGRKGVQNCVMCHVAGAEDKTTPASGTQDPAPDTIDFKVLIHKLHNARDLSVVLNGGKYDLVVYGNALVDFSTAFTPVMPDGNKNCAVCHATDAWKTPVERTDVNIWKVACTSCHDSAATSAHVTLNTLPGVGGAPGIESCATCHASGAAFAVDLMHATP
jgi:OmcA/MtrC family decaheme c-type cytochrome